MSVELTWPLHFCDWMEQDSNLKFMSQGHHEGEQFRGGSKHLDQWQKVKTWQSLSTVKQEINE